MEVLPVFRRDFSEKELRKILIFLKKELRKILEINKKNLGKFRGIQFKKNLGKIQFGKKIWLRKNLENSVRKLKELSKVSSSE